ncbi:Beta-amyrin 28-monooxygenase [Camellia lanceoleosa]|uniref:Beta-amyrin 28-monooxygenase n=1 Tax=Camellia lanceoleosa TaxID=1840588 RepID=A0ACC0GML9_9ERIC|nr:Beta-amyrin 28-monooxygenase [Camellia lanceoleosa]
MDALLSCLLLLVILAASLFLVSRAKKHNTGSGSSKLPPGTTGWPLVGESMKFVMLGPEKYISGRMKDYSPDVFRTSLLGETMAVFCGPAGNKFLFSNDNKLVTSWLPLSIKKALVFPDFVDNSVKDIAALKRNFMHEILKPEALRHYIPIMDSMARQHIEADWSPRKEIKVLPLSKKYTFDLACRLFLNIEDSEDIKRLSEPFSRVISGLFSVPIDFPGTAYSGAIKGGKMVRDELLSIIRRRAKQLSENKDMVATDLLSRMLLAVDQENDKLMNEMEISNNVIGLLVASYDTTSISLTMVLNFLAQLPHIYQEVMEEQMEIAKAKGPGELLNWEDIEKMKYSWNVVREALRLTPPAQGSFREAKTDFTYAGFTIPKGWKTFWTVHTTHKNPQYFPEREKFDPSRFEGSGPAPYTFVPFGGGPRMCPGKEYARLEILVFLHNVVAKFKMEKTIPNEKIVFHSSPTPVHGVPVRLHPHEK